MVIETNTEIRLFNNDYPLAHGTVTKWQDNILMCWAILPLEDKFLN